LKAVTGIEVYFTALQQVVRTLPAPLAQASLYVAHHHYPSDQIRGMEMAPPHDDARRTYTRGQVLNAYLGKVAHLSARDATPSGHGAWSCAGNGVCARCHDAAFARGRSDARHVFQRLNTEEEEDDEVPDYCMDRATVELPPDQLQHGLHIKSLLVDIHLQGANAFLEECGADRIPSLTFAEARELAPQIEQFWVCRSTTDLQTHPLVRDV